MRSLVRTAVTAFLVAGLAPPSSAESWRDSVTFTLSDRARGELTDWFRPPPGVVPAGAQRYGFFANQLRAGVRVTRPRFQLVVELQDTRFVNLPGDASLPSPFGNLGPGAVYFANTRSREQGETFLKLGYLTYRRSGVAATLGRFEIADGLETVPPDPTLAWLKRNRIAERLVGPFSYTMVTRSFDGVRVAWDRSGWNLTAFGTRPTQGGYEVSANPEIDHVGIAGAALTFKQQPEPPPWDARLYYLFYRDARSKPVKVDNRPLAVRQADHDPIDIHTVGAHAITALDAGPGTFDALGWSALQVGEWGLQQHLAWAWALEVGYQLRSLPASPWLRAGYDRSSGDGDPSDDLHESFFQALSTARLYAQLPFYNLMNDGDVFAQLILRPADRVTLRFDYHWLQLTEGADLLYSGGGATNGTLFGFSGIPGGGRRELAHVVDVALNIALTEQLSLYVYYGHAFGQAVIGNTFAGRDADYAYSDLTFRY